MKEIDFLDVVKYVCNDTPWKDDTDIEIIINQANLVFNDVTINKTKDKKLYRLCGQTGSGKTTQLLYAMEGYTKNLNLNPVILGVRCCSTYHPDYNKLLAIHGQNNIREITNGFALKCMTYLLKLLMENGYMVLLDITLLDPIFESFILNTARKNGYEINYHIMSVSNEISSKFILKREKETGRKVNRSSSKYFNHILDKGYNFLVNNDNSKAYIWNVYDLNPIYVGNVNTSSEAFNKWRTKIDTFKYNENELKEAKLNYLLNEK
jgi:hypothetical protein